MRFFAFLADDGPTVGVVIAENRVIRLRSVEGGLDLALAEDRLGDLIAEGNALASAAASASASSLRTAAVAMADLEPLPAIEFPGKIVCVGLNYAEHVAEGGRAAPDRPLLFAKFANAVVGDGEPVVRPEGTHALDLEVELGVVIGRRARRVPAADAMVHVAGYVVLNDISARDWQGNPQALREGQKGDGQWLRAKGSDTFLPVGSIMITGDAFDPAAGHRIRSWRIPGAESGPGAPDTTPSTPILMQDGTTADLVHGVPELIEFITRQITLEPGDLIATGTPSGVGVFRTPPVFLEPGDRVRCEIEGIGTVENPIIDWSARPPDEDIEPA
ncbi:MAG: FAA hydrolase family protein [Chloroflexota bacterium]|nr:MAG: FAA hydrolase family protein [Chloroflexota bacterium]